jgi:hypothetical protein
MELAQDCVQRWGIMTNDVGVSPTGSEVREFFFSFNSGL